MTRSAYRGRFAPSPTGLLHAGSLATALASWLDARAHGGQWLVRIEDIDPPRCVPGADAAILAQLAAFGLVPDEAPVWQSKRQAHFEAALEWLIASCWAYHCSCTRAEIVRALTDAGQLRDRHTDLVYPGTCRNGVRSNAPTRAVRLRVMPALAASPMPLIIDWQDRRLGALRQNVSARVGDFVLKRADGLWAYQLAVVVDDAAQGITHVVRGEDLADNTPRQIHLQHVLGLPTPAYMHTPLVLASDGEKLSKQNGATPVAINEPLATLRTAGRVLGIEANGATDAATWLADATHRWRMRWAIG
jgi:glutamyl-Q tRNA(Asp) synthetase